MATRVTGLATGMDIDTLVSQTMQAYRSKIDVQQQQKDILEIKQKLYRDVISESQDLYNKHFDVLKSGSLMNSSSWQSVKFTSSNENIVSVTGSSDVRTGSYTVTGKTAKAASLTKSSLLEAGESSIVINGKEFEITSTSAKDQAKELNKKLSDAGINVSVRYTDFAGSESNSSGFIFESTILGKGNDFTVGGTSVTGTEATGLKAKGASISGDNLNISLIKANAFGEDGSKEFTMKIGEEVVSIKVATESGNRALKKALDEALSKKGYTVNIDDTEEIIITSNKEGSNQDPIQVAIKDSANSDQFTEVETEFLDGIDATKAKLNIDANLSGSISINGVYIDLNQKATGKSDIEYINTILKNNNSKIELKKDENDKFYLESNVLGIGSKIDFKTNLSGGAISKNSDDANIVITDEKGGVYKHIGTGNSVTLDGMTFTFNGTIPSEGVTINSKKDATDMVDKIKTFVEDYNAIVVKLNTLVTEKRDRDYQPLTKTQREALSEEEVKLWDSKVEKGQLRRDSDLMRVNDGLKEAMRSMVSGTGINLKDIGIESVIDYGGVKDGTFKINETKLKSALENDTESVKNLFIKVGSSTTSTSSVSDYSSAGIMNRMKDVLYNNTVSTKSNIIKKAGLEGSSTALTNTLTVQMAKYTTKIQDMESLFSTKEQALYTKYASLETMMNNYNSQLSYLTQSLGA